MTKSERQAYDRRWYAKNRERIKESKYRRVRETRTKTRRYLFDYLKNHPCIDCGENDPIVLEFDHVNDKSKNIADMIGCSLATIKKEIDKCEVRCANCHRRKTAKQFNWYQNVM